MPETQTLIEGGISLITNGLLQSDLDAAGFRILNLDSSNLNFGAGPISFPAQASKWLNSFDSVTRLFTATRPLTTDLSDFPSVIGHANEVMSNDGAILKWVTPQGTSGLANKSQLNVRQAPYNAAGDGVTDDYVAINQALLDAAGGLTVYFPKGTYLVSQPLAPSAACSLMGDNPYQSVIRLALAASGGCVLQVPSNSNVNRLGFDGALSLAVQPVPLGRNGVQILNASGVTISNCVASNCSGSGLVASGCFSILVRDCLLSSCGGNGIQIANSPKSVIMGNRIQSTSNSGIWVVNSPHSSISDNQVYQCGAFGYGIGAFDSDNSVLSGNIVQQCLIGMVAGITGSHTATRPTFGYTLTGNNLTRNYYGGILVILASGVNLTGNTVTACGQGGTDGATYTVEPGVMPDIANAGTGYSAGQVLTLLGGTGTPAKVAVLSTGPGGSLLPDGLAILTPGVYSVWPPNPVSVSGGTGSGAKLILTGASIFTGGLNYFTGQVLAANVGTFYNPVRVLVTSVDSGGAVTGYQILDGGGYFDALPASLTFVQDAFGGAGPAAPDVIAPGTGFILLPSWGLRYSQNMNGRISFGISFLGAVNGGVVSGNQVDNVKTGVGILVREDAAPYNGRASWLSAMGNTLMNNLYHAKGASGYTLDDNYNINSNFYNIIYPPLP